MFFKSDVDPPVCEIDRNAEVYFNELQVEIKQEEELIIEDENHQQQVFWSFIGLDNDETDDEQEFQLQFNNCNNYAEQFHYSNCDDDEIIEISDEEVYKYNDEESLNDSLQVLRKNVSACSEEDCPKTKIPKLEPIKEIEQKTNLRTEYESEKYAQCAITRAINEQMARKELKIICNLCGSVFQKNAYHWLNHIKEFHPKFVKEIESNYKNAKEPVAVCKICNIEVHQQRNIFIHYITCHTVERPKIFLCAFCNLSDTSAANVQAHKEKEHPVFINKHEDCPRCDMTFTYHSSLEFHFMTSHVREFNSRLCYKCHLCEFKESNTKRFFDHLVDTHKLGNLKNINFRKVCYGNGHHMMCTKCCKIFVKNENNHQLLTHYLGHENRCSFTCKYCKRSARFKDWPSPHLCTQMREFFQGKSTQEEDKKIFSWEEFEANIQHICPFCNADFRKFDLWRLHVRDMHQIQTLEGLNMKTVPDNPDKLLCLQCNELVVTSAIEMHKHRFQHLPYKPYKCSKCLTSLATYNDACAHVKIGCKNRNQKECKTLLQSRGIKLENDASQDVDSFMAISCTLCNKRFANCSQLSKHFSRFHENFTKHFTKEDNDKVRFCKICKFTITKADSKKCVAHYLQHLSHKPYKCMKCHRTYLTASIARRHIQIFHMDQSSESVKNSLGVMKKDEETQCQNKIVETNSQLDVKTKNENTTITFIKVETESQCLTEQKDVKSLPKSKIKKESLTIEELKSSKVKHAAITEMKKKGSTIIEKLSSKAKGLKPEKINGDKCTQLIMKSTPKTKVYNSTSSELLEDATMSIKKGKPKVIYAKFVKYACPECNKPLDTRKAWNLHISKKHSIFQPHKMRLTSVGIQKAKCLDCNTIVNGSNLKQLYHKLSHMQYKSFICDACQSRFNTLHHLYRHVRRMHLQMGHFTCDLCPSAHQTDWDRLQHIKAIHPQKEWPQNLCPQCCYLVHNVEEHLATTHANNERLHCCPYCGIFKTYAKEIENHVKIQHAKEQKNSLVEKQKEPKNKIIQHSRLRKRNANSSLALDKDSKLVNNIKRTRKSS